MQTMPKQLLDNKVFLAEYNKDIDEALPEYELVEYISQEEMEKKCLNHIIKKTPVA